jgi:hypothetical protein
MGGTVKKNQCFLNANTRCTWTELDIVTVFVWLTYRCSTLLISFSGLDQIRAFSWQWPDLKSRTVHVLSRNEEKTKQVVAGTDRPWPIYCSIRYAVNFSAPKATTAVLRKYPCFQLVQYTGRGSWKFPRLLFTGGQYIPVRLIALWRDSKRFHHVHPSGSILHKLPERIRPNSVNYWVFGLCPSCGSIETRKDNVSVTGFVSVLSPVTEVSSF